MLDKWTTFKIKEAADWKRQRLEAKTGYLPLTDAILRHHDPARPYHFSNEADLINRIVFGMPAEIGMDFQERKEHLIRCHNHELIFLGEVA